MKMAKMEAAFSSIAVNDYRSEIPARDKFLVANAMGVRNFKVSETPQVRPSDLASYMNWVPNKDKQNLL